MDIVNKIYGLDVSESTVTMESDWILFDTLEFIHLLVVKKMQDLYFNLSQKLYLLCETFHNK